MRKIYVTFGFASVILGAAASASDNVQAPPVAAPAVDPMQQMVCRRDVETGSLVRVKKTCHTRAQWRYIEDSTQSFSRDLVDASRTKPSGD